MFWACIVVVYFNFFFLRLGDPRGGARVQRDERGAGDPGDRDQGGRPARPLRQGWQNW